MPDQQYVFAISGQDLSGPAWQSFLRNAKAAQDQVKALKTPMEQIAATAEGLKSRFDAIIGNEILQKFLEFNKRVAEQTGALKDQADGLNLTTDQLQGYISAFAKAGYSGDDARASLNKFNQTIGEATLGNKGAIDSFNTLGVKILDATGKLRDPNAIMAEAASKLVALDAGSQRTALSMQLFGRSGGQLTPVLRDLQGGVDDLIDKAKDLGTVSTPDVIDKFEQLNKKSATLKLQIDTLYGAIAAPIETAALDRVNEKFATFAAKVKEAVQDFGAFKGVSLGVLGGMFNIPLTQVDQSDKAVNTLTASLAALHKEMADDPERASQLAGEEAALQGRLGRAQAEADEAHQAAARRMMQPAVVVTAPLGGGDHNPAAKTSGRNRIEEEITRLEMQTQAAQDALASLMDPSKNGMSLEKLQQAVALDKQIADESATAVKFGATPAQKDQIVALVTAMDSATAAAKRQNDALSLADSTQKTYGTNGLAFTEEQTKLTAAFDTGRLSLDAYNNALKQGAQAAEDLRLKNIGLKGGADAFIAGWENQQNQFTRANTAFEQGGQLFTQVTSLMDQALNDFATNGQVNFGKLLSSFLMMIAQMELKAAASSVFGMISGGAGGGGGLLGFLGLGGGGAGASAAGELVNFGSGGALDILGGAFAAGGDPPVGMPSLVGENGPELFVPKTAGTVIPNGGGMGGGDSVTVHQYMSFGSDVSTATLKVWSQQIQKSTIAAIISDRQHGGKLQAAFAK